MTENQLDLLEKKPTTPAKELLDKKQSVGALVPQSLSVDGISVELNQVITALQKLSGKDILGFIEDPTLAVAKRKAEADVQKVIYKRDAMIKATSPSMWMRWAIKNDYAEITYEAAKAMGIFVNFNIYQCEDTKIEEFMDDGVKHYLIKVKVRGERGFPELADNIESEIERMKDSIDSLDNNTIQIILMALRSVCNKAIVREYTGTIKTNKEFYFVKEKVWKKTPTGKSYPEKIFYKDGDEVLAARMDDMEKHARSQAAKKVFGDLFGTGNAPMSTLIEGWLGPYNKDRHGSLENYEKKAAELWDSCSKGYSEGTGRGKDDKKDPETTNPSYKGNAKSDVKPKNPGKPATDKQKLMIYNLTIGSGEENPGLLLNAEEEKKNIEKMVYADTFTMGKASDMIQFLKAQKEPLSIDEWEEQYNK